MRSGTADSAKALGVHCLDAAKEDGLPVIGVHKDLQAWFLAAISRKMSGLPAYKARPLGLVLLAWLPAVSGRVAQYTHDMSLTSLGGSRGATPAALKPTPP